MLGIEGGYSHPAVKSAWDSLAELIGKQITLLEDIEQTEVSVGKKFIRMDDQNGNQIGGWSIFITDVLDNGAGYATSYSTPERFNYLLTELRNSFSKSLQSESHMLSCSNKLLSLFEKLSEIE